MVEGWAEILLRYGPDPRFDAFYGKAGVAEQRTEGLVELITETPAAAADDLVQATRRGEFAAQVGHDIQVLEWNGSQVSADQQLEPVPGRRRRRGKTQPPQIPVHEFSIGHQPPAMRKRVSSRSSMSFTS